MNTACSAGKRSFPFINILNWYELRQQLTPRGIKGSPSFCLKFTDRCRKDLNKVFIQLTLEFLAKQKFEAYESKGAVVAGDKNKEVLVHDIWVFEKSLFHPGANWRLCGGLKFNLAILG